MLKNRGPATQIHEMDQCPAKMAASEVHAIRMAAAREILLLRAKVEAVTRRGDKLRFTAERCVQALRELRPGVAECAARELAEAIQDADVEENPLEPKGRRRS